MSIPNYVQNIWVDAFDQAVQDSIDEGSMLSDRVTMRSNIKAGSYRFIVAGRVNAKRRGSTQEVQPNEVPNAKPVCLLEPWESFNYIDKQDEALTDAMWYPAEGKAHGTAVGVQKDEVIIEALKEWSDDAYSSPGLTKAIYDAEIASAKGAARGTKPTGLAIVAGTSSGHTIKTDKANSITADDIISAVAVLRNYGFARSPSDTTIAIPAIRMDTLAIDVKEAYWNYMGTGGTAADGGAFGVMYGCVPRFIPAGTRDDGFGQLATDKFYVFDRAGIGMAMGTTEDLSVMDWAATRRSVMFGAECNGGACRLQNAAIVVGNIKQ